MEKEVRHFKTELDARRYAGVRNFAVANASAPLPRRSREAAPDSPFCVVAPVQQQGYTRFRAYWYLEGQPHAKEVKFDTQKEALRFANAKNLEFDRHRAAREAVAAPVPPEVENPKRGEIPGVAWTPAQMEGVDSGHSYNPVKGPPYRIAPTTQHDYSFVVYGPAQPGKGGRSRAFFKTDREAKTFAHMRNTEAQEQGLESLSFPAWLRVAAQRCHAQLAPRGKSIEDATRHFIEYLDRTEKSIPLGELVKLCIASKKGAGFSKGYLYLLHTQLPKFCAAIGKDTVISEITTPRIVEHLASIPGAAASRNSVRMLLCTLFSYAEKTGYRTGNPARATMKEKEIAPPVGILTPAQIAAMLDHAAPGWLPFLAIGAFAGLRTAELLRLDWAQVDLTDGFIEVTAQNAKNARRRLVKILPALDAYLRPFARPFGRVAGEYHGFIPTTHIRATMDAAGIEAWPRNALRHSFASYHIAHFRDAAALALEMGHTTTDLIFQHYRQVVKQADGARYWALRPSEECAAHKVVSMNSATA